MFWTTWYALSSRFPLEEQCWLRNRWIITNNEISKFWVSHQSLISHADTPHHKKQLVKMKPSKQIPSKLKTRTIISLSAAIYFDDVCCCQDAFYSCTDLYISDSARLFPQIWETTSWKTLQEALWASSQDHRITWHP